MIRVWLVLAVSALWLASCSKHPEVDEFKQIQIHWNALDEIAETSEHKDNCVIEITSKVMLSCFFIIFAARNSTLNKHIYEINY